VEDALGNGLSGGSVTYRIWWDVDWSARRKLIFDNSGQGEDLTGFPVLVKVDSTRIAYGDTQDGGEDLRFVDGDGSVLSHEVEEWNESGESVVWVKVPLIDGGSDTDHVWMYWGNGTAGDGQDSAGVWSDYEAVWHLDEETGTIEDSTGNGNEGERSGDTNRALAKTGYGMSFDGDQDYIGLNMNYATLGVISALTLTAWFNTTDNSSASYNDNWAIIDFDRSDYYDFYVCPNGGAGTNGNLGFSTTNSSGTTDDFYGNTGGLYDGTWHLGHAVFNGSTKYLYLDGEPDGTQSPAGATIGRGTTRWGIIGDGSEADSYTIPYKLSLHNNLWYTGMLDEIRISYSARSADWIKAQYLSMNDGFITFEDEE